MRILEAEIETSCYLAAYKAGCSLVKIKGVKGWPDRLLITPRGRTVFMEFKRPGGTLAPLQKHILEQLCSMNQLATVVSSVSQFKEILTALLPQSGNPSPINSEDASGLLRDPKLVSFFHREWERLQLH